MNWCVENAWLRSVISVWYVLTWMASLARGGIPEGSATLAFVFDTTGSMYDDLVQVRAGASKILSTTLEMKTKPLYNYVLIPFHDPGERFASRNKLIIHHSFIVPAQ